MGVLAKRESQTNPLNIQAIAEKLKLEVPATKLDSPTIAQSRKASISEISQSALSPRSARKSKSKSKRLASRKSESNLSKFDQL